MAFGKADPLGGDDAPAVGYRYRKWTLGDGVTLVTRCELDGASELKGETVLLSVKALTEFDSKVTGMDRGPRLNPARRGDCHRAQKQREQARQVDARRSSPAWTS